VGVLSPGKAPASDSPPGATARHVAISLALVLLTIAVFSPVLGAGYVVLDDRQYVAENPVVRDGLTAAGIRWAFTTVEAANWHPLTWLSLMADVSAFGNSPAAHHAVNLAIHAAGALFLYFALHAMTGAFWRSAFVAALFAVHPLHVESVAWISERKDVLSGAFWMLALWGYARYPARRTPARYAAVAVPFALGLLSKPMVVTLPFALLLLDVWPLRRWMPGEGGFLRLLYEKAPLLLLSLASCLVTVYAQRQGGAMGHLEDIAFPARLGNAILAYAGYLGKSAWPAGLSVFYPHPGNAYSLPLAAGAALLLLLLSAGALFTVGRKPWLAVGWFWFLGTLVPVIGIVQVGMQAMSDRYMYIPLVGLAVAVAWEAASRFPGTGRGPTALAALSVAVLAALGLAARAQAACWKDSGTLLEQALRVDPDNWFAEHSLGIALAGEGRYAAAAGHFRKALRIRPNSLTMNGLGAALWGEGDTEGAAACFADAVRANPGYPDALANLGLARLRQGRIPESIELFRRALKAAPGHALARRGLDAALARAAAGGFPTR
jgi:Flp pilus assembly protein TadD